MSYRSNNRRVFRKINAANNNARWRADPATERQWTVLRRMGRETGQRFPDTITRGEASALIAERFKQNPQARHQANRARRKRRRVEHDSA